MTTAIANPKAQYLLGASLEVLHFESSEWIETIHLWKDEVRFFKDLVKKRAFSVKSNPDYQAMIKNLDAIYTDLFDDMERNIIEHEKLLSKLEMGEKGISDQDYRKRHEYILSQMDTFSADFTAFKKILFHYEKGL
ncbi:hypothetical protein [Flavobacterium sp. 7A]|uniref:hypothetical protein n=1 Tax=Flavobacterium sp. 7A TaxID=2940571 RepID=UPI0022267527|nr:hypothetical protein [Flavobacterium sp. 7A]MCW2119408.1 hypothetical protein [Flavobacterium sp. 7A]